VLYAYYHIVRQHYGFMALYRAVNGERDRLDRIVDTWTLYVGLWAPYAFVARGVLTRARYYLIELPTP
jgi:hypothetical protein